MTKILMLALLLGASCAAAEDWGALQFLVGTWVGEGGGQPGNGSGSFTFAPDLQGRILVRRNFAEYPAAGGKPAFRHDDLMIVHREAESKSYKAVYYDNEGHVIHYAVRPVEGGVVMTSEGEGVRYRLTYTRQTGERILTKFEIAAPGKDFATYLEATVRRQPSGR